MRAIRSKGMKPEILVRQLVHGMGYRYRLHDHKLPGRPDMVFASRRKVIFVNGCFWHQHSDPNCRVAHTPRSNLEYWRPKLKRTQDRDAATWKIFTGMGWQVFVVWECETREKDLSRLKTQLQNFLDQEVSRGYQLH